MKFITALILIAIVANAHAQTLDLDSLDRYQSKAGSMLGTPFSYTMLTTSSGRIITSPELEGKVVMYNDAKRAEE